MESELMLDGKYFITLQDPLLLPFFPPFFTAQRCTQLRWGKSALCRSLPATRRRRRPNQRRETRTERARSSSVEKGRRGAPTGKVKAEVAGEGDSAQDDTKPVGDMVKVSNKGRWKKKHYATLKYDDLRFELKDPVLLSLEVVDKKRMNGLVTDIHMFAHKLL